MILKGLAKISNLLSFSETMKPTVCFLLVFSLLYCGSKDKILPANAFPPSITVAGFSEKNWQEKVIYLRNFKAAPVKPAQQEVYRHALEKEKPAVKLAALRRLIKFRAPGYKKQALKLTRHKSSMVRWHSLLYIEYQPAEQKDLRTVMRRMRDKEWLVRESAFRSIRRYPEEKEKKKYLNRLIFALREKNPNVLRQIYRTLRWYEDTKAFPFLYKRSYHGKRPAEMMVIMQELSYIKNPRVKFRLRQIARKSKSAVLRSEARRLLARL